VGKFGAKIRKLIGNEKLKINFVKSKKKRIFATHLYKINTFENNFTFFASF